MVKIKQGKICCSPSELNLGITLNSGQSFRWKPCGSGYRGVFAGCVWTLIHNQDCLLYKVQGTLDDETDYKDVLSKYLRLEISLKDYYRQWSTVDPHFQEISKDLDGVRILHQDVVENLFSFICSSNNNITRISGMVHKLCLLFGQSICTIQDEEYFDFPTIEALSETNVETLIREKGFGYRAAYISNTAQRLSELGGKQWLKNLHKQQNSSYDHSKQQLMILPGVGPKVAECVCLMSLGHLEAIPVDTHIFQVARATYLPALEKYKTVTPKIHDQIAAHLQDLWGPLAGWAQAVVFCTRIKINDKKLNEKKRKKKQNPESADEIIYKKR